MDDLGPSVESPRHQVSRPALTLQGFYSPADDEWMRPPSQQPRFPIGLAAAVVIAMLTAAVVPGSGLVIGVLLFVACLIYTARAARRLDPPDT